MFSLWILDYSDCTQILWPQYHCQSRTVLLPQYRKWTWLSCSAALQQLTVSAHRSNTSLLLQGIKPATVSRQADNRKWFLSLIQVHVLFIKWSLWFVSNQEEKKQVYIQNRENQRQRGKVWTVEVRVQWSRDTAEAQLGVHHHPHLLCSGQCHVNSSPLDKRLQEFS